MLCVKFSIFSHVSLSPLRAHQKSERTYYYGPSEIIEVVDVSGGKVYLCRYKDWISANTVKRNLIFWSAGDQVGGSKIDYNERVNFTWFYSGHEPIIKLHGIVNDANITSIGIMNSEDKEFMFERKINSENMFVFCLEGKNAEFIMDNSETTFLVGKNNDGEVIFNHNIWDTITGN
jgi:hypothetical protein